MRSFTSLTADRALALLHERLQVALLHERLRAAHVAWLPAVPRVDRAGAYAADVRCEEHDVRCRRRNVSEWLCSFQNLMYFD